MTDWWKRFLHNYIQLLAFSNFNTLPEKLKDARKTSITACLPLSTYLRMSRNRVVLLLDCTAAPRRGQPPPDLPIVSDSPQCRARQTRRKCRKTSEGR